MRVRSFVKVKNYKTHTHREEEYREREKETMKRSKRKDSAISSPSEHFRTAEEPVIFRAEPAFISSCRIFLPATRSSEGASTSLPIFSTSKIDNLDPLFALCYGHLLFSPSLFLSFFLFRLSQFCTPVMSRGCTVI